MTATAKTHWRQFGQGRERALAIHCTLGHAGSWRGVGAALGDALTIRAYDLPSHGKSANWDGLGDLHDACTAPARAALEQPLHLIGHSFGATIALRLAVENPEAVKTLTLIEPVYFAAAGAHDPAALARYTAQASYVAAMANEDWAQAAADFNTTWGAGRDWRELPAAARKYMIDRMPFVREQTPMIHDDNAGLLAPGRLERAAMPCLLLKGSMSPKIISSVHDGLAARLPHAHQKTLEGVGHMSPVTHPDRVAAAIRRHLETA